MIIETELSTTMDVAVHIFLMVMIASLGLAFLRLYLGPTLPDRVIALDLIASITVGIFATYSIVTSQPVFIDAAIVLALIVFLSTVAFARYTERRGRP